MKIKTKLVFLLSALSLCWLSITSAYGQNLSKKAPDLIVSTCLNKKIPLKNFHKNKYLVLDFWATWCGPCISEFPHLDSLSTKFSSDSVLFAIISSENKKKVAKFLQKRKINAYYLIDSVDATSKANTLMNELNGITAQNFGVGAIPFTIVIDKNNDIVWTSYDSGKLTESVLNDIIHHGGKDILKARENAKIKAPEKTRERSAILAATKMDTVMENNCQLITAKLPYIGSSMSAGVDNEKRLQFMSFDGRQIDFYYFYFTRIPFNRIKNLSAIKSIYANIEGDVNLPHIEFCNTALDLLKKAYQLTFIKKKVVTDVYLFEVINEPKFKETTAVFDDLSDHVSTGANNDQLIFSNSTLESVTHDLEDYLHIPVLLSNESLKDIRCDMTIKKGNPEQLSDYLNKTYGVILKKKKQEVEFIEISHLK